MKLHPMPPVPEAISERIKALVLSGIKQPVVIREMRLAGLHIGDCIRLTRDIYGISLGEAKRIVHESDAWASMRGEYDAFHAMAEAAAIKAGFEVVPVTEELQKAS